MGITILIRGKWKAKARQKDAELLARGYGLDARKVYDQISQSGAESKDGSIRIRDLSETIVDPAKAGRDEEGIP